MSNVNIASPLWKIGSITIMVDVPIMTQLIASARGHFYQFYCLRLHQWPVTYIIALSDWIIQSFRIKVCTGTCSWCWTCLLPPQLPVGTTLAFEWAVKVAITAFGFSWVLRSMSFWKEQSNLLYTISPNVLPCFARSLNYGLILAFNVIQLLL